MSDMMDSNFNIFCIEDNPGDYLLFQELLGEANTLPIRFANAQTLAQGVSWLLANDADMILLDLNLPDSNGLNTFHEVQKRRPDVPIIVLTGTNDEQTALKAVNDGAQDYLLKNDLSPPLLARTIQYALERHRSMAAVAESEKKYRALFENAADAIFIHDTTGRFQEVNELACRRLGYSRTQLLEMTPRELDTEAFQSRIPERLAEIERTGMAVFETEHRTRHGTRIPTEISSRVIDYGGKKAVLSIARDITERKKAELEREYYIRELQIINEAVVQASRMEDVDELCRLLAQTVHHANPGAFICVRLLDPASRKITMRALSGFNGQIDTLQGILGVHPMDLEFDPARIAHEVEAFVKGKLETVEGGLFQLLHGHVTKDRCRQCEKALGIEKVFAVGFSLSHQPYGGLSLMLPEGTELKYPSAIETLASHFSVIIHHQQSEAERDKLENQLRQAQKLEAIGTLAGGIAHDFNNILSSIIGYSELLLSDAKQGSLEKSSLEQINIAGTRARELVKQILTFSRQTEKEKVPVCLKIMIKEAMKLLRASIPVTVEITADLQSEALVMGDPSQIHQVLMNLCTNAAQALPDQKGRIELALSEAELDSRFIKRYPAMNPGRHIRLRISDNGVGIEAQFLQKIFDPFFTTKPEGKGTGLGLSVVHGIVQAHAGLITAESQPGQGSTFTVYLPIAEISLQQPTMPDVDVPKGASEKILFVDDEAPIAQLGQQMLNNLGYDAQTRTSSIEALEAFRARPQDFDLLITDLTMPQMTGVELIQAIREIRPEMPVVLCTGFSEQVNEQKAAEMGIQAFLLKPIVRREMAETIRSALGKTGPEPKSDKSMD